MSTLTAIKAAKAATRAENDPTLSNQHQPNKALPVAVPVDPFGDEPPF
jgi:hypothetical protein